MVLIDELLAANEKEDIGLALHLIPAFVDHAVEFGGVETLEWHLSCLDVKRLHPKILSALRSVAQELIPFSNVLSE